VYTGKIIRDAYDMLNIYIGRSDKQDLITREVYTLFSSFTRIGGFATFIFYLIKVIVS
jgi:hypothetical protein